MSKKQRRQLTDLEKSDLFQRASSDFDQLRGTLPSMSLFMDATAILDYHDLKSKYKEKWQNFIDKEGATYRFITSTYVVTEVLRRILNANTSCNMFRGPDGEEDCKLVAHYVINEWLHSKGFIIICVTQHVFDLGRKNFEDNRFRHDIKGWTLTDAISCEIVKGLRQKSIASSDNAFRAMNLTLLPG